MTMKDFEQKYTYYNPGDLVTIKHNLPNKPVMVVEEVKKKRTHYQDGSVETVLLGISVLWFDNNGCLNRDIFNSKDLIHTK